MRRREEKDSNGTAFKYLDIVVPGKEEFGIEFHIREVRESVLLEYYW